MKWSSLVVMLAVSLSGRAHADTVPPELVLPPSEQTPPWHNYHVFDEADFKDGKAEVNKRGHFNDGYLSVQTDKTEQKDIWALFEAGLTKAGWKVVARETGNPYMATLKYVKGPKEMYATFKVSNASDVRVTYVEVAKQEVTVKLNAPAAKPEVVADKSDFPYITPYPGSHLTGTTHLESPMDVTVDPTYPELAGSGTIEKIYEAPSGLSNLQFSMVYEAALKQAGWDIAFNRYSKDGSDLVMLAHYSKQGRDIWVSPRFNGNNEIRFMVADNGTEDELKRKLEKECHVPLYGIHFDFDKATLKPESDSVLNQILTMMKSDARLEVELQGHTDDKGADDYNMKLSNARALTVKDWISKHGIDAKRLSSQGFGKNQPIVPNTSDENSAKNRRVEIALKNCKKK